MSITIRKAPAMVYITTSTAGHKYVGMTKPGLAINGKTLLDRRLNAHFSGKGAKWTQKHSPVKVSYVQKCKSLQAAKRAETAIYKRMRDYHGIDKVRGAGHTSSK
jgi:predicted GIY-YIG superfamily endonuclease